MEIMRWILTGAVLLCAVFSNLFFTFFRRYQASLPTHKHVLLNILFSHLAILWQFTNLVCSIFTITEVIFSQPSPAFSCSLYFIRQFQIIATTMCVVFISITRLFANFWTSKYLKLNQGRRGRGISWVLAIVTIFLSYTVARVCDIRTLCPENSLCPTSSP